jgi:superfamily II DNA or RNA helicase
MQRLIICGDNDYLTVGNPGRTHATAAATAINAILAIPPDDVDWNDMAVRLGGAAVTSYLDNFIRSAQPVPPTAEAAIQKYELRPYQQRAMSEIKQAIATGYQSIMIQSPTGSGKGVMLSHIINLCHQRGSSVLFLVHRQEILYQVSEYMDKYGIEHGIIKAGEKHEDHHPVQLASFQTITRRLKSPYIKQADVIIVDEAHHATAETYLRVIEQFKKKVVLGFSATPSRQSGQGLGNMFDTMIQVATIKELTTLGFLAPVRVYAPVKPDLAGVKVVAGDYQKDQLESAMMKSGIVKDVVGHYQQYGQGRKAICFATGVKHSMALCQQFHSAGITAAHVDGKTPKEDRDSILARFKTGNIQIIVNCMIFTEGVDVPDIGCVILARPTKSLPMYLQMVGRGTRAIKGKTDCILLDHAGAVHEHGFPDEVTEWELSTTSKTVNNKQEQRKKKESEPIGCPVCGLLYTAQLQCPGCGNIPTLKQIGKDIEYIDGVLGEVVRKSSKRVKEPTRDEKESWFRQFKRYAMQRGHKPKSADCKYKEKFGVWPNRFQHLSPAMAVSEEVLNWIRHTNIKRANTPQGRC